MEPPTSEDRLSEIVEAIQALARLEFETKAHVGEEGNLFDALAAGVNMLGEELSAYHGEVESHARTLSYVNAQLARRALYDSLTGLANRSLFRDRLGEALREGDDLKSRVAVITLDLDRFKEINDSFGHGAGDQVLIEVAHRLKAKPVRGFTAARVGGDEFSVLLERATGGSALEKAEELARRIREPFGIGGQTVRTSASVGIALSAPGMEPEELIRNADAALYASKAARTGAPQLYRAGMHDPIRARLRLGSALRGALERLELSVAYQPIVDIRSRSVVGFEALARWHDRDLGTIPPSTFIPLAEQIGVMPQLGDWVLASACEEAGRWPRAASGIRPYVTVNLSAIQLKDSGLPDRVAHLLSQSGLPPDHLVLEVTESELLENLTEAIEVLGALRRLGLKIALDDFGTGHSSLSQLRHLPVDIVKIDRTFVAGIATDPQEWAFAQAVNRLVGTLGLTTVAEGVEDAAQLAHVRAIGCDLAQGFYLGVPQTAEEIRAVMESDSAQRVAQLTHGKPEAVPRGLHVMVDRAS